MGRTKLRLGIAGCGEIAGFTALVSRLVPEVTLAACCDVQLDQAQSFARRYRIPHVYTQYDLMLAQTGLDAVYLAVPHDLHTEMILAAVQAGKAVLAEKPLARSLVEGERLYLALSAHKEGTPFVGVNYQYRYDRGCYALARAVQEGALGRVFSVRLNLPWRRNAAYFEGAAWHKTIARSGGGSLLTQGSHLLDIALWALGESPVSAAGYTSTPGFDVEVDTLAHGIIETEGGTLVSITATMAAASEQALEIEMYGERGTAVYTDRPWPRVRFAGVKPQRESPPERGLHALQRSLAGFTHWILHGKPFLIPFESSLPVLAAVDAVYRSARSGQRESVGPIPGRNGTP